MSNLLHILSLRFKYQLIIWFSFLSRLYQKCHNSLKDTDKVHIMCMRYQIKPSKNYLWISEKGGKNGRMATEKSCAISLTSVFLCKEIYTQRVEITSQKNEKLSRFCFSRLFGFSSLLLIFFIFGSIGKQQKESSIEKKFSFWEIEKAAEKLILC